MRTRRVRHREALCAAKNLVLSAKRAARQSLAALLHWRERGSNDKSSSSRSACEASHREALCAAKNHDWIINLLVGGISTINGLLRMLLESLFD